MSYFLESDADDDSTVAENIEPSVVQPNVTTEKDKEDVGVALGANEQGLLISYLELSSSSSDSSDDLDERVKVRVALKCIIF